MRQELVARLGGSRKYRNLCPDTLERIAGWALERASSASEASLVARRKLHQVYGAYWHAGSTRRLVSLVDRMISDVEPQEDVCRSILSLHASTRERLSYLDRCYRDLWAVTGPPSSVADPGCGLSPFSLPWMNLPGTCEYYPSDIDTLLIGQINRFLAHVGRRETAVCRDLLLQVGSSRRGSHPKTVDVCLLFKTLSCLERQDSDLGRSLLGWIRCRYLVISMPTRSLGGANRGMADHYRSSVQRLLEGRPVEELLYPGEIFFVVGMEQ